MIIVLLIAVAALGISVYDAALSPAVPISGARPALASLAEARLVLLLPDGKVEITDAWARRVFQWNGRQWVERESTSPPAPVSPR
jgi:hypothetical protein